MTPGLREPHQQQRKNVEKLIPGSLNHKIRSTRQDHWADDESNLLLAKQNWSHVRINCSKASRCGPGTLETNARNSKCVDV